MIGHGVPGINISQSYVFSQPSSGVFLALTEGIDAWWPKTWRLAGEGSTLSLAAEIGSAMLEVGPGGSAAIWGWIDALSPPSKLHLLGNFGVEGAVSGHVQFKIEDADDGGCRLAVLHQAIGPVPEDRGARYRSVWRDALNSRLRSYLDGGTV